MKHASTICYGGEREATGRHPGGGIATSREHALNPKEAQMVKREDGGEGGDHISKFLKFTFEAWRWNISSTVRQ